ncbi:MAG: ATP synthase F1 subunit epsilon [Bdellovibrionia bacterium]
MSEGLLLSILSPERRLVEKIHVQEVTLSGSEGEIQILPGHAAMIGTLETGIFSYRAEGAAPVSGVISSGFFEVKDDTISVMAETLELKKEIDLSRAQKAQQQAEETLKEADLDELTFKKYQLKLQRAIIRQRIGAGDH